MIENVKNLLVEAEGNISLSESLYIQDPTQTVIAQAYLNKSIAFSLLAIATMMAQDREDQAKMTDLAHSVNFPGNDDDKS